MCSATSWLFVILLIKRLKLIYISVSSYLFITFFNTEFILPRSPFINVLNFLHFQLKQLQLGLVFSRVQMLEAKASKMLYSFIYSSRLRKL